MMEMTGSRGELLDGVQQLPRVWANMIRFDEDCHYSYLLPKNWNISKGGKLRE